MVSVGANAGTNGHLTVRLARPRGFCAGVERAIEIVERALARYGTPVYVRHEIVHNRRVVETLERQGAVFVEEVDEIPEGAVTVFSAHGVARKVAEDASEQGLKVIDATCPLVSKVHRHGATYSALGYDVILIGHRDHPEVEGTMGRIDGPVHVVTEIADVWQIQPKDPDRVAYITQTTLSVDDTRGIIAALKDRFPRIEGPDTRDICYATQNRQTAVRQLAHTCNAVLVVGAANSSNSNRLREIAAACGTPSYLVADSRALDERWLRDVEIVGITAGASAPEDLVQEVVDRLRYLRAVTVELQPGAEEHVTFQLPDAVLGG